MNVHQSVVKEIFTMNKYCFTNDDTAYILKYSIAREAIEAAIVHVFKDLICTCEVCLERKI